MTDTSISYGSKYDRDLDVADIAKRVRADIKAAVKAGELPNGLKTSVRISRYSMGRSLDVAVKACPGVEVMNPARAEHDIENNDRVHSDFPIYTEDFAALLEQLRSIVRAYNFNGSDIQADYFHVNFHSTVDLYWRVRSELHNQAREDARKRIESRKAAACTQRADACAPTCPGWLWSVSAEHGFSLERCDECGRFADDDEAARHAGTCTACAIPPANHNAKPRVYLRADCVEVSHRRAR